MSENTLRQQNAQTQAADALSLFSAPDTSPEDRRDALTVLISNNLVRNDAYSDSMRAGLDILLMQSNEAGDSPWRLLAIAECIRLSQVDKRLASQIFENLKSAFRQPLPPLQNLAVADDRLNLVRACAQMTSDWIPSYLAQGIAEEEGGEKARIEAINALLAKSTTLSYAIKLLAKAFSTLRPSTESPSDTIGRRLIRSFQGLRGAIIESEIEAGSDIGKSLYDFLVDAFSEYGRPTNEKVKIDLSREILSTLHELVRTRISAAVDPTTYRVVAYCRRMCGERSWPEELSPPLDRLVFDVTEALLLIGRQGTCDQPLREQLDVLVNHKERARNLTRKLSARNPDLPEGVRKWLETGRLIEDQPASEPAIESAMNRIDEPIGIALSIARDLQRMIDTIRTPILSNIEIFEPNLLNPTSQLLNDARILAIQMQQIASTRSIDLYGIVGEEIEFSAKYFIVAGKNPRQKMIVRTPAVVRMRTDGTIGEVIVKGIAE